MKLATLMVVFERKIDAFRSDEVPWIGRKPEQKGEIRRDVGLTFLGTMMPNQTPSATPWVAKPTPLLCSNAMGEWHSQLHALSFTSATIITA